jgi:hypothetical protein
MLIVGVWDILDVDKCGVQSISLEEIFIDFLRFLETRPTLRAIVATRVSQRHGHITGLPALFKGIISVLTSRKSQNAKLIRRWRGRNVMASLKRAMASLLRDSALFESPPSCDSRAAASR